MNEKITVYTLEQVAEITQYSMTTIYRHVTTKKLKANKIGGSWRVSQKQLDEYLKGGK